MAGLSVKETMTTLIDRSIRRVLDKVDRAIQKPFYAYLTRRVDDDVVFLNWGYEVNPPLGIPLDASDERNRYPIQLYHVTATQAGGIAGKRVLEVGCGRGGGASYLTRALRPESYVGLDLNKSGIEFCRRPHQLPGLQFVHGHAEELPFPDESFDAVINVESSHCYPHFDRFLSEVARVLRPGGAFLYADVRPYFQCAQWEAVLNAVPAMQVTSGREINAEVLRGMELNSPRWEAMWDSAVPRFLHRVSVAPVEGAAIYRDVQSGQKSYRMYCLQKS
jgi:fatty-acid O-methyltransferase